MLQLPATALNHLLSQSGWALQRLVSYSGKTARFNVAPFSFCCTIQGNGSLRASSDDVSADVICIIPPTLIPRLVLHDEAAFAQIAGSGDTALLAEIIYLGRHLRWDAAEDITRATGDIAAERIVRFAQSGHQQLRDNALNLSQALAEYWTEEFPLLVKPEHIAAFAHQIDKLYEDMERLEQRINQLI